MGFFNKKKKEIREIEPQVDDVLLKAIITGEPISEDKALSIPALAAAVSFIADTVSALPVKLYRDSPEKQAAEEISDDVRVFLLNDECGDLLNSYECKKAMIKDMLLYGAGYLYIGKNGNSFNSLRYVNRNNVAVSLNADPIFKDADIRINGTKYMPWGFVILTRNSKDGVTGLGLIKQINELLSTLRNEMIYEGKIAQTGGNKKGFLQSERKLTQPAIDELKAAWKKLYSNNGDNMMVLNDGIKYQQAASTSVEMQLNEHKSLNAEMIAQCCGLNTAVISGRATNEEYMAAVRTAILPVTVALQSALNRSMLLESEKRNLYFELDTTDLLKGDMVSRFNAYAVGLQNNFLKIDEVRYKENLPPIGFDYIKLGLQDVLLDPKTGEIYTPNTNQMVNIGNIKQNGGGE